MMRALLLSAMLLGWSDGRGVVLQPHTQADDIVEQMRTLPVPLPPLRRSDGRPVESEVKRRTLYDDLRRRGAAALPALARGLRDPDVRLRRNVTLALGALGGTWWNRAETPMDITPLLADLVRALQDEDSLVRSWAAQAIAHIGPKAGPAVPALIVLLASDDEGSRNSACIALRGIGPAAAGALPALREALRDPSADVRGFAQRAIAAIEGRR